MLELLFKQMGFNPADIKKQVDTAADNFTKVINHFNARLDKIERLIEADLSRRSFSEGVVKADDKDSSENIQATLYNGKGNTHG